MKEEHVEEFLRSNIEVIFQDETLLVVGKQVTNKENGRSNLTAVDENSNLVLIEIKRDVEYIKQRKEAFEFQVIRYAASYAKIKTKDELVEKLFASYIDSKPRLSVSAIMPGRRQPFTIPAGDNPSPAFFIPTTIYTNCIPL